MAHRFDQVGASRTMLQETQQGAFPRVVEVGGLRFILEKGVFPPDAFSSTRLFTAMLPFVPGGSFLEIGCGAGVTSIVGALSGVSRVLAVDISARAVRNTTLNARLYGVERSVQAVRGDIFESLPSQDRFDLIYWNLPFIWQPLGYRFGSTLERALFDPGYALTARFLREAEQWLVDDGRVFIGFGDFGSRKKLDALARKYGLQVVMVGCGRGFEGRDVEFQVLELVR